MKPTTPTRAELVSTVVEWVTVTRGLIDRIYRDADRLTDETYDAESPAAGILDRTALLSLKNALNEADTEAVNIFMNSVRPSDVPLPDVIGMVKRMRPPNRKAGKAGKARKAMAGA